VRIAEFGCEEIQSQEAKWCGIDRTVSG